MKKFGIPLFRLEICLKVAVTKNVELKRFFFLVVFSEHFSNIVSTIDCRCVASLYSLGRCNQRCQHFGAAVCYAGRLEGHSSTGKVEYHVCYRGEEIFMEDPPAYIKRLFGDKDFIHLYLFIHC